MNGRSPAAGSVHERALARLWPDRPPATPVLRALLTVARFVYALLRDLAGGQLTLRAMSLVYTSMLAFVPLLAFSFSVLKGLGFHRQLEPLLLNFFAPLGPQANRLTQEVIGFVDNVSGSALAGVSLGLILFTALSMAQKVENSFNFVWHVEQPRSFVRRFSDYLSVMLIGPVLMSVAMAVMAAAANTALVTRLREIEPFGSGIAGLSQLAPYLLLIGAFSFLYAFVPNTRVKATAALVGGLFAGSLWAAGGGLFTEFVATASRTQVIYSGFAIVIAAMLWLYLSWLILLTGAQLSFYYQNPDYLRRGHQAPVLSNTLRERLALATMLLVGRDFDEPRRHWRPQDIAAELGTSLQLIGPVLNDLLQTGLLVSTADQRLVPGRTLRHILLVDILSAARAPAGVDPEPVRTSRRVDMLAAQVDASIDAVLGGKSLAELIDEEDGAREPAAPAGAAH